MNGRIITLLGLAGTLSWSGGPARTSEPPDWTVREEFRLRGGRGPGDVVANFTQLAVGRDGAIHLLAPGDGITVFDRDGALIRRIRIPTGVIAAGLREHAESALSQRRDDISLIPDVEPLRVWSAIGWLGDTLWAVDRVTRRVELLGPQGNSVAAIPFPAEVEGGRAAPVRALLADRSLLRGMSMLAPAPRPATYPRSRPPERYRMPIVPGPARPEERLPLQRFLVRAAPDGTILEGLEIVADPRPPLIVESPYGGTRFAYPFQDHPLVGVRADGREVVVVERYAAARPAPAHYSIVRFDVATGRRSVHFHEYMPAPITTGTIDSLLSRLVDSAETGEPRRFAYAFQSTAQAKAAIRAALDVPLFHAPVDEMVVGADRTVWLREQASGRWLAHTPDGAIAGRVSLPSGSRLVYADSTTLWVATAASGGNPGSRAVVRYRIVKP